MVRLGRSSTWPSLSARWSSAWRSGSRVCPRSARRRRSLAWSPLHHHHHGPVGLPGPRGRRTAPRRARPRAWHLPGKCPSRRMQRARSAVPVTGRQPVFSKKTSCFKKPRRRASLESMHRRVTMETRRVVTGVTAEGKSVFTSDDRPGGISVRAIPGLEFFLLWGTERGQPVLGADDDAVVKPYFPSLDGTRFLVVRWAPDRQVPEPVGDPAEISAELRRLLPGLADVMEPDSPGMHTTDSIDYAFCADGEMWLELDDGQEVHLTPGSCVVQRGTRHAWHNRGDRVATMIFVQIGAERDSGTGRDETR